MSTTEEDLLWKDYFYKQILKNIHKENKIDWTLISLHPYVPLNLIHIFPHMPWDWNNLSRLSFDKIESLLTLFPKKDWDWHHLSISSPICFIEKNPSLKWQYDKISRRKYSYEKLYTPLEYALKNLHMPWNWPMLSRHPSMSMDHLFNHPSLPWDMEYVFKNCAFSAYHLRYISTNNRNYHLLSQNPHNRLEIVRRHISKPWDWVELAQNIAFVPQHVHLYKKSFPLWRWDLTLRNPRITWSFFQIIRKEKNIHRQFHHILKNHFRYSNSYFVYFTIIIRRFLKNILRRKLMLRKLHILTVLKSKMDIYVLKSIIDRYIA